MLHNLATHWKTRNNKPIYIKEMVRGSAWVFVGNGLARLLTLAGSVIIARALGKESFGEYSLALNTLNMLAEAATFGAGLASAKYISESINKDKNKVTECVINSIGITLFISLIFAAVLIAKKEYIARTIFNNASIAPCFDAVALGLIGAGFSGTLNSILSGLKKFRIIALLNTGTCFLLFCLQVAAALTKNLLIVTYATAGGYFIMCAIAAMVVHRELIKADVPLRMEFKPSALTILYKHNLPAFLSGMTVVPVAWAANLLLARENQGYSELAVYAVANQWRYILLFIPMTVASVALPILSGQNKNDANKLLFISISLNAIITLTTCAIVYPFIPFILSAYGSNFSSGNLALSWMLVVVFLVAINSSLATYLTSQNRFWSGTLMNCLWALSFFSLSYWLIPTYKVLGLMYAYVGSYSFHLIIQTLQAVYIYGKQTHTHH
ncbi:MAG: hypothetical protein RL497_676 [Pseudomonadota bacterium]|jgi:O-antigen/teichoic acid export membrane protein